MFSFSLTSSVDKKFSLMVFTSFSQIMLVINFSALYTDVTLCKGCQMSCRYIVYFTTKITSDFFNHTQKFFSHDSPIIIHSNSALNSSLLYNNLHVGKNMPFVCIASDSCACKSYIFEFAARFHQSYPFLNTPFLV